MAFTLGGINCTCCSVPVTTCDPCNIPDRDLAFTLLGNTYTITYSATGGTGGTPKWSYSSGGDTINLACGLGLGVTCNVHVTIAGTLYTTGAFQTSSSCFRVCSPFHLSYKVQYVDGGGFTHYVYGHVDDGTGGENPTQCCVTFGVTGCNGMALAGVTATIAGSSGTTDSGGNVSLSWGSNCGSSTAYTAVASRFTTVSTSTTPDLDSFIGVAMTKAAGYSCSPWCPYPLANTLHAVHPVYGAITFTHSGSNWVASVSYAYPGGGSCAAKTVTVTCTWDGMDGYTESWKVNGSNCPDNAGGTTHTATWDYSIVVCFIPSSASFLAEFSITPGTTADTIMYGSSQTLDITE